MKKPNNSFRIGVLILMGSFMLNCSAQVTDPPFLKYLHHPWVDSVFSRLSPDERIAQSIWVATWSNRDISHYIEVTGLIKEQRIGGLIFFQGTAAKQAELINHYQSKSDIPLLIATDAEWGAGMRLDNIEDYPYHMTLGAITDDSLIYKMGADVARQLTRTGINVNFAPVADINNNPLNPVINYRSFGEDRDNVAGKALMYASGLQANGILATAKHFPGHGDTRDDSHYSLPVMDHSSTRFDTLELFPFRKLIGAGVGSIMIAHLNIPALDPAPGLPSSLSRKIITGLLKDSLGYSGLIVTDAMNMKGVTGYSDPGKCYAMAYSAGNDVLEYVDDVPLAIGAIKRYRESGSITDEDIEAKCRKILALKYWCGLSSFSAVPTENIEEEMVPVSGLALIRDLYAASLTLLNNHGNVIPVRGFDHIRIATLAIGSSQATAFQDMLGRYATVENFRWTEGVTGNRELLDKLSEYDLVIAGVYGTDQRPQENFGISEAMVRFIRELTHSNRTIITYFGNPYAINLMEPIQESYGLLLAYQENKFTEELSAQLIMGGIGAHGKLPVTINDKYPLGSGIITPGNFRLQYGYPENAGMNSTLMFHRIDSLVGLGLTQEAYPGCEVIAARRGVVVYHKTFGYHTFDRRQAVVPGDLYDIASITKIAAGTAGLMLLDDMELFSPDWELQEFWPGSRGSDKAHLKMRDILAHQAGFVSGIPYWRITMRKSGSYRLRTFRPLTSEKYETEVIDGLFLHSRYRNKIYKKIKKSSLGEPVYLYSGLAFFLLPSITEELTGRPYEEFLNQNIYRKIGADNLLFNPVRFYPKTGIVPTEVDTLFRHRLVHGYVHDENASMLGGVSGNAGLFATGNDLLKLLEMFRTYGSYGGDQIISSEVLREYTRYQFPENDNRRGMGFDKPQLSDQVADPGQIYPCPAASGSSFGHSGFTGTFAWVDPEHEISYLFLSNRVYPTRENNKLSDLNIRTEILQSLIDSIVN